MTIRKAKIEDALRIREIAEETWPVAYAEIISAEQIQYMLDWMYAVPGIVKAIQDEHSDFLVLDEEGILVGFAGIEYHFEHKPITRLHKLYLLPSLQGTGKGKALLDAVVEEAKTNGSELIHLNVNKANTAVAFYLRNGFTVAETMILDIGHGFVMDDYVMTKVV